MIIPVAEWKPDLHKQAGDSVATNVIPDEEAYRPWPSLEVYSNSLSARCQGAIAAKDKDQLNYNYAGDATNLYVLANQTWTEASRTTSASYSTAALDWWEFALWGQTVIATNFGDEPQQITLGATHFANLPGNPPKAKHVAIVRDFVVLGNTSASALSSPQRVQWSAINNSQSWTIDATTQADFQDLAGDGGHVQKVVGGNSMIVFQERAIWRGQYVGSPIIFDFGNGPIEPNTGVLAPQSVAQWGAAIFFLSEEGFRMWNGMQSVPIGAQKIDRTFFNEVSFTNIHRIQGVVDSKNKLYICLAPVAGSSNGNPNKAYIYNFLLQKWSSAEIECESIFRHIATGYTLDGLDTVSTDIDALPASLDSPVWAGGQINLAVFDTSHRTSLLNGAPLTATVNTVEVQHIPGQRTYVTRVRPLVNEGSASVAPVTRNALSDAQVVAPFVAQRSNGDCPVRTNARYHSYRIVSSDFKQIQGVELISFAPAGNR